MEAAQKGASRVGGTSSLQTPPQGSSGEAPVLGSRHWLSMASLCTSLLSGIPVGRNRSASPKGGKGVWGRGLGTACHEIL